MYQFFEWTKQVAEKPRYQSNSLQSLRSWSMADRHTDGVQWVITGPRGIEDSSSPAAVAAFTDAQQSLHAAARRVQVQLYFATDESVTPEQIAHTLAQSQMLHGLAAQIQERLGVEIEQAGITYDAGSGVDDWSTNMDTYEESTEPRR